MTAALDPVRPIELAEIEAARERIAGTILRTPLVRLELGPGFPDIRLKLENLQPINAYKLRGAANAVAMLSEADRKRGVWTISAGNAGQGVAYAARRAGVPCTVVVIETAPASKLERMKALGAKLVPVPYAVAWKALEERAYAGVEGTFVHPFDDHDFIAGHGTMGLEILEDAPDVTAVIGAIGGGGLVVGVGSAIKALKPEVKIWGAEPATAAPAARSFAAGSPQSFPEWQASFVDGAGGQSVFPRMWERMKPVVDGYIVVTLDETRAAMRLMAEKARVIAEGAGALPLAAALTGKAGQGPIVAVVSGGNIDLKTFCEESSDPLMAREDFASDNVAGAMPEVMEALAHFNGGFSASYGEDEVCARAGDLIRRLLDVDAEVRFAANGTAANALTLATLAAPHESVIAHEHSHVATDETGAPGFFGSGMGVIPVSGASGQIEPAALAKALTQPDDAHWQSPAALTLTNATEFGVRYDEARLGDLISQAKTKGLKIHLDGARLANAVAGGFDPKALARLGVDVAVLGGTKAGATPTEAIVLIDRSLSRRFGARLKHGGQLVSKSRFLAAPWIGMLESGAWSARAAHANAMATRLAAAMPFTVTHPVESNAVFVEMDAPRLTALHAAGWFVYRFTDGSARFMCSWATTEAAVDEMAEALRAIA